MPKFKDPNILVGGDAGDDAGVYAVAPGLALVQTVDVLTPVVDDPYVFGQIAAANALSDIYAMGGQPITALTIVSCPADEIPLETVSVMLQGAADMVRKSGAVLLGGHTTKNRELKLGLAVTGTIAPDNILTKSKARPGDLLILTKPLGSGVITTAVKADLAPEATVAEAQAYMVQLNDQAAQAMVAAGAACATDVTGFGLLGHAGDICERSGITMVINAREIPLMTGALELARMGLFPAGSHLNFEYARPWVFFSADIDNDHRLLLCDAQTSGGLLIAIPRGRAEALMADLHRRGVAAARIIGEIVNQKERRIYVD